jgi:hypothetical protein
MLNCNWSAVPELRRPRLNYSCGPRQAVPSVSGSVFAQKNFAEMRFTHHRFAAHKGHLAFTPLGLIPVSTGAAVLGCGRQVL